MFGEVCCSTILYLLLSLVVIFPPQEAVSSGITIENILQNWIGSESLSFVHYHIKRTSATIIGHFLLLPGYIIMLFSCHPWLREVLQQSYHPWICEILSTTSLIPLFVASFLIFYWSKNNWRNHPLAQTISRYTTSERSLVSVTEEINGECARIDKVTSDLNSVSRIIVTNHWLIKVTSYRIYLASLRDIVVVLESSEDAALIPSSTAPAQLITARIVPLNDRAKSFSFRVNSSTWGEMEKKFVNPVINTKHIVVHHTLADRFSSVFEEAVMKNPRVSMEVQDSCIGCMAVRANVKIDRRCLSFDTQSKCQPCACRPMWCLSCLGKWFAARQDPTKTDTWLSSRAPCPTCRSHFCLFDVFVIE